MVPYKQVFVCTDYQNWWFKKIQPPSDGQNLQNDQNAIFHETVSMAHLQLVFRLVLELGFIGSRQGVELYSQKLITDEDLLKYCRPTTRDLMSVRRATVLTSWFDHKEELVNNAKKITNYYSALQLQPRVVSQKYEYIWAFYYERIDWLLHFLVMDKTFVINGITKAFADNVLEAILYDPNLLRIIQSLPVAKLSRIMLFIVNNSHCAEVKHVVRLLKTLLQCQTFRNATDEAFILALVKKNADICRAFFQIQYLQNTQLYFSTFTMPFLTENNIIPPTLEMINQIGSTGRQEAKEMLVAAAIKLGIPPEELSNDQLVLQQEVINLANEGSEHHDSSQEDSTSESEQIEISDDDDLWTPRRRGQTTRGRGHQGHRGRPSRGCGRGRRRIVAEERPPIQERRVRQRLASDSSSSSDEDNTPGITGILFRQFRSS